MPNDPFNLHHRLAADPRIETANLYRVSKLKLILRGDTPTTKAPWRRVPPPLTVYRERGHRRLSAKTFESKCEAVFGVAGWQWK